MSGWTPPKFGTPSWVAIPATDIDRAHKFYETVFNFSFKSSSGPECSALRQFSFEPDLSLSGGIKKVPDEQGVLKPGLGGICIFWFVEDIDKSAEMIEKAGGNMVGDVVPEGDSGVYRYFVDTEGSMAGVYQYRPSTKE